MANWEVEPKRRRLVAVQAERKSLNISPPQLSGILVKEDSDHPTNPQVLCLPGEIIIRLFANMPLKERGVAMRTCERMKFLGSLPLSWKPLRLSLVRSYVPTWSWPRFWDELVERAPRYEVIKVANYLTEQNIVDSLIPFGPHLVELNIPAVPIPVHSYSHNQLHPLTVKLLEHCPNLRLLEFGTSRDFAAQALRSLVKLENLAMTLADDSAYVGLEPGVLERFAELKTLRLSGMWSSNAPALENLSFNKLTHLQLYYANPLECGLLGVFLAKCPNLIWYEDNSYFYTTWILDQLALNCPKIEHIEFGLCRSGLPEEPFLGQLKSLKNLIINLDRSFFLDALNQDQYDADLQLDENAFIASFPQGVLDVRPDGSFGI